MRGRCASILLASQLVTGVAHAGEWGLHMAVGTAFNVPLRLVVRQEGAEPIDVRARFATRGFRFPLYYVARVSRWNGEHGWALELRHHKLFLEQRPDDIQRFDVSHGYNLLTALRVSRREPWASGFGAGVVIAHPENEVRGRPVEPDRGWRGYVLAGLTSTAFAGHAAPRGTEWHSLSEIAATASWARVPVAAGSADVPNLALHGTVGLGWR